MNCPVPVWFSVVMVTLMLISIAIPLFAIVEHLIREMLKDAGE